MIKKLASFIILFFFIIPLTRADCDAVLSLAGKNISTTTQNSAVIANKYASACFSDIANSDNSTTASLDVQIFGEGGGNGSLNTASRKTRLINWCSLNKSTYENNQSLFQQTQTVYGASVAAWKNCKEIEAGALQLNPVMHDNMLNVDFLVRTTDGSTSIFKGVVARGFSCKARINEAGKIVEKSADIAFSIGAIGVPITCVRDMPTQVIVEKQPIKKYGAGSITINTAGKNFALEFVEKQEPELLQSARKQLEEDVRQLKTSQTDLLNNITALDTRENTNIGAVNNKISVLEAGTKFVVSNTNQCPPGWTLISNLYVGADQARTANLIAAGINPGNGVPLSTYVGAWPGWHPSLCTR